jgi:hypothetical protein
MPPRHTSAAKAVAAAPRSSRLTLRELVALGIVCLLGIFCFEFLIEGSVTSEHVNVGTTAAHDKHLQHAASLESGLHRLETKLDSMMYRVNLLEHRLDGTPPEKWDPHNWNYPTQRAPEPTRFTTDVQSLRALPDPAPDTKPVCSEQHRANWRYEIMRFAASEGARIPEGDVFQFGVFNGGSLILLRQFFPQAQHTFWGFDSFEGLPAEPEGLLGGDDVFNSDFAKGRYKAKSGPEALKVEMLKAGAECQPSFEHYLRHYGGCKVATGQLQWVVGYYDAVLNLTTAKDRGMRPAAYLDIDADIYSSSVVAIDWMFANGLIQTGTVFGYDDWWINTCTAVEFLHPLNTAEGRAHKEMAKKYNVVFKCVGGSCAENLQEACTIGPLFQVVSIGAEGSSDHGFHPSNVEIDLFRKQNTRCVAFQINRKINLVSKQEPVDAGRALTQEERDKEKEKNKKEGKKGKKGSRGGTGDDDEKGKASHHHRWMLWWGFLLALVFMCGVVACGGDGLVHK